ncbi:hypothetical protein JAAARDRAFT_35858 [Jaapia argillacea MUCL 33604]|uniref:BZIP domain-containing protein n=1 Tax=Jaapia argillacea MUCL 33604 TaxID=933084 RepID=A0A067Q3S8_9AGAM|nr:hypothetical protein JAAARDRAFT_35858 [Jaapia argillacea MUCL 33604]
MSSKRGRKRNDNLPPNRARDVQRAFRARRAAHLQAMEKRVEELEEENNRLRAALNLPPANRPSLGKGPTGKDKPKSYSSSSGPPLLPSPLPSVSGATSSGGSPASSRTSSLSPSAMTAAVHTSPHPLQGMENSPWDHPFLREERTESRPSPVSSTFPLSSVNSISHKQQAQFSFNSTSSSLPSSSRQMLPSSIYIPPAPQQNFSHSADRPPHSGGYDSSSFLLRDLREEPQSYSYSQSSFPSPHQSQMHPPPLSESTSMPAQLSYSQRDSPLSSLPFSHRRSITEPLGGYRPNLNQYSNLSHPQGSMPGIRLPSPPRLQDGAPGRAGHDYGDTRVNPMQ